MIHESGSTPSNRQKGAAQKERFLYAERSRDKEVLLEKADCLWQGHLPLGAREGKRVSGR